MIYSKVIIAFIILSGMLSLASIMSGYTLVINLHNEAPMTNPANLKEGQLFDILDGLNLNKGKWNAYLVLGVDDLSRLPPGIPKRTCLKLSDPKRIKEMKADWKMRASGGDMATITSSIVFTQNGKVRWESGIDITDAEGLQSSMFGWADPVKPGIIRQYANYFKPVYLPFIILR